jgi:hypothetical protein
MSRWNCLRSQGYRWVEEGDTEEEDSTGGCGAGLLGSLRIRQKADEEEASLTGY